MNESVTPESWIYIERALAEEAARRKRYEQRALYALAHPRADGATHVVLDPLELLEKLAVLVPVPRTLLNGITPQGGGHQ